MKNFFKFPALILIVIFVITIILGIQLPNLVIDNDTTNFLPKTNPSRMQYHEIEDTFGGNMVMGIGVKFKKGFVYSRKNLEFIEKLTAEFETIPNTEKITSIANVDYIIGNEGGIETMKLIDSMPENEEDEKNIKNKLTSWKTYKGNFYSEDFKSTMVAIKLGLGSKNENAERAYKEVKKILKQYEGGDYEFYVAGLPSVLVVMAENMRKDLARLIPFVVIILIGTLYLSFRSIGGVILPTVTVLITTVCTLGLMAIFHVNLTMVANAIPVLMIAVGSAYGIHIISHYYDEIDNEMLKNGKISEEENSKIIFHTLKRIGGAVLLAALTTIAG
ncbi:MAG TPA: MMPL family transporter, partial [Spirochaetota bacterium]|nr:MMPL family transporter [Spirochaetota bacterium]